MSQTDKIWKAIARLFDEQLPDQPPNAEEEMLRIIMQRVTELMHTDMGLLLSHLYRLDVDEQKVNAALSNRDSEMPVAYRLAKLIWERQKQRILTKEYFKKIQSGDIPEEYKW